MKAIPDSLEDLINQFSKLPGIGRKTAERLAIFILKEDKENVNDFSETSFSIDKKLQGGIKVRIGNKIIDGSVSTKLKKIKKYLLST